jgi:hypothetical protein
MAEKTRRLTSWLSGGLVLGLLSGSLGIWIANATARWMDEDSPSQDAKTVRELGQAGSAFAVIEALGIVKQIAELGDSAKENHAEDSIETRVGLLLILIGVIDSLKTWVGEMPHPASPPAQDPTPRPELVRSAVLFRHGVGTGGV